MNKDIINLRNAMIIAIMFFVVVLLDFSSNMGKMRAQIEEQNKKIESLENDREYLLNEIELMVKNS